MDSIDLRVAKSRTRLSNMHFTVITVTVYLESDTLGSESHLSHSLIG